MAKYIKNIVTKIKGIINFFDEGIWHVPIDERRGIKKLGISVLRVILLSARGFQRDECPIRASALTYFTLLSIVPVIAVAFAISKGFGLEQLLEKEITNALASQKEVMTYVLDFSKKMLYSTKGGVLAIISIGFLLYTVLKLFHNIENTVNLIWNVNKSRTFLRKFTDYMSIVFIAPILMVGSSGATVYINTTIKSLTEGGMFEIISPFLFFLMQLIPFVIVWLLFSILYLVMPNTKIKFSRAFIAGIIAGTVFQSIQIYYIDLQFAFSRYNAVYGSFAALPLFLIWVQFSWLLFLFGAEVSAAIDKAYNYGNKYDYEILSYSKKRFLNFLVLTHVAEKFKNAEIAPSMEQISENLKLPIQYIEEIVNNLTKANLLSEVVSNDDVYNGFQPAIDISTLSFAEVYHKIDNLGSDKLFVAEGNEFDKMNEKFKDFAALIDKNYSELLIKNM